jgi:hypothetical protein
MNQSDTPKCDKCKSSSNMVNHVGEWVCHSTHRENQSAIPTPRTDAHQMIDGMAHDWLWRKFAKTLERELTEAQLEIKELKEGFDMDGNSAAEACCIKIKQELTEQRDLLEQALRRLLNAHQPKPFGGIIDEFEQKQAIHENSIEILEATKHARQYITTTL